MATIYCISGLGATRRLFENLTVPGHDIVPLDWLEPLANEPIRGYAARLAKGIPPLEPPILLGVSFGGMVALEMAHVTHPRLVILISTAKSREEIPWYLRMIGRFRLHRLFPYSQLRHMGPFIRFFNGSRNRLDKHLLDRLIAEIDLNQTRWGVDRLVRWPGTEIVSDVFHIHGTKDHVFPIRHIRPNCVVPDGTHMMIADRGEIGAIIAQVISSHGSPRPDSSSSTR